MASATGRVRHAASTQTGALADTTPTVAGGLTASCLGPACRTSPQGRRGRAGRSRRCCGTDRICSRVTRRRWCTRWCSRWSFGTGSARFRCTLLPRCARTRPPRSDRFPRDSWSSWWVVPQWSWSSWWWSGPPSSLSGWWCVVGTGTQVVLPLAKVVQAVPAAQHWMKRPSAS